MSDDAATSMAVCLAREIHDGDVVGIGLGTPLALAAALMARRTTARGSHLFTGGMVVGADADLLSITHGASALRGRYTGYVRHLETMEMAERRAMTLQFLRPAQIDGAGNINTSRVIGSDGSVTRLPGGLASADVPRILPRLVLYHTEHRTRSLPQAVSFITGAGGGDPATGAAGPVRLITDRAVFSFAGGRARLESVHAGQSVREVLACTGFECESDSVAQTEPPSPAELAALQAVDEHALRELELRATRGQAQARLAAALARLHSDPEWERTIVVPPSTKPQETTCRR